MYANKDARFVCFGKAEPTLSFSVTKGTLPNISSACQ